MLFDYSLSTKWLELLKEIAPGVTRAAVLRDPAIPSGIGQWGAIQSAAPSLGVEVSPVNVRDAPEIERGVAAFARSGNGGLIVTGSPLSLVHRELIIALAARHKLPTVYFLRAFVTGGGLISYGPDVVDQSRRAAGYVDRILKGEKPADLPVQAPTKYELVDQPQDRQGARPRRSADAARPRRRGDRVRILFVAVPGSACGTDRRTAIHGQHRRYRGSSRREWACGRRSGQSKMTLNRHKREDFAAVHSGARLRTLCEGNSCDGASSSASSAPQRRVSRELLR